MPKLELLTNDFMMNGGTLAFGHSSFVLRSFISLEQPIHANGNQKHRAYKCVALKKRAIDSSQIAFFGFVLVNESRRDQRQRPVVKAAELCDESKSDERHKCQQM